MAWQTLIDDDFSRPDSPVGSPGNRWLDQAGIARINAGQLLATAQAVPNRPLTQTICRPESEAQVAQRVFLLTGVSQDNQQWDVVLRRPNSGQLYTVEWRSDTQPVRVLCWSGGGSTTIKTTSRPAYASGLRYLIVTSIGGTTTPAISFAVYDATATWELLDPDDSETWGTLLVSDSVTHTLTVPAGLQAAGAAGLVVTYTQVQTPQRTERVIIQYDASAGMSAAPGVVSTLLGGQEVVLTGSGTDWTPGTPGSPALELVQEAGEAVLASQVVESTTSATVVIIPTSTEQSLLVRDPDSGALAYVPALLPTITPTPAVLEAGAGPTEVILEGYITDWVSEPPVIELTGGVEAEITEQEVLSTTELRLLLDPGTAGGLLTLTDPTTSATCTVDVEAAVAAEELLLAPYVWYAGDGYVESIHPGAYLRAEWTGTYLDLEVDVSHHAGASLGASDYPTLRWRVDDEPWQDRRLVSTDARVRLAAGAAPGAHTVEVRYLRPAAATTVQRWTGALASLRLVALWANGAVTAPEPRSRQMLVYADSIGEGVSLAGATGAVAVSDATQTFIPALAAALDAEYGPAVCRGQGYTRTGSGSVPPLYTPGGEASSAWDKYGAALSRLTAGLLTPAPDVVVSMHGTNDGLASASPSAVTAAVTGWLTAVRAAAPRAQIVVVLPPGRYQVTAITAGVVAYRASAPRDLRVHLLDLGEELARGLDAGTVAGGTLASADGVHPRSTRHAAIAAAIAARVTPLITPGRVSVTSGEEL